MTAKTSAEMRKALFLVMSGMTGREAARQAGVREESLYRNAEYKEWRRTSVEATARQRPGDFVASNAAEVESMLNKIYEDGNS